MDELENGRLPGRPAIGGAVHVRLGDVLARVDEWAERNEVTRAEAVRRLVELGLLVNEAGVSAGQRWALLDADGEERR